MSSSAECPLASTSSSSAVPSSSKDTAQGRLLEKSGALLKTKVSTVTIDKIDTWMLDTAADWLALPTESDSPTVDLTELCEFLDAVFLAHYHDSDWNLVLGNYYNSMDLLFLVRSSTALFSPSLRTRIVQAYAAAAAQDSQQNESSLWSYCLEAIRKIAPVFNCLENQHSGKTLLDDPSAAFQMLYLVLYATSQEARKHSFQYERDLKELAVMARFYYGIRRAMQLEVLNKLTQNVRDPRKYEDAFYALLTKEAALKLEAGFKNGYSEYVMSLRQPLTARIEHVRTYGIYKARQRVITINKTGLIKLGLDVDKEIEPILEKYRERHKVADPAALMKDRTDPRHDEFASYMFFYLFSQHTGVNFRTNFLVTPHEFYETETEAVLTRDVRLVLPKRYYCPVIVAVGGRVRLAYRRQWLAVGSIVEAAQLWLQIVHDDMHDEMDGEKNISDFTTYMNL